MVAVVHLCVCVGGECVHVGGGQASVHACEDHMCVCVCMCARVRVLMHAYGCAYERVPSLLENLSQQHGPSKAQGLGAPDLEDL